MFLFVTIVFSLLAGQNFCLPTRTPILDALTNEIFRYQVLKPQNYSPPFKWAEKVGLFQSDIRINFVGDTLVGNLRNSELTGIFDNDMFSSGWILTAYLDSLLYGSGVKPMDVKKLNLALEAMNDYHDKNQLNANVTPIKTFWPQNYNSTYNTWQSTPINIRDLVLNVVDLPWPELEKILAAVGLGEVSELIKKGIDQLAQFIDVFQIPPDFDDTYLNMGLGATLSQLQKIYPGIFDNWSKSYSDVKQLIDATVKYAYRPFDNDSNNNIIDPRTYFASRKFLEEAKSSNKSVALITTWIQNIDEQRRGHYSGVSMPFNLNNVDVTVAANSIYGIASSTIFDINGFQNLFLQNSGLQQIFLNSTNFISWAIKSNFTNRPDLMQVYYPSTFNFLWYSSRTLFLLQNEIDYIKNPQLRSILSEAKAYLQDAFENAATQRFFNEAKVDKNKHIYFEDFLGVNDTNILGQAKPTGEDRIFSTAQVVNTLIATWTYQNPSTGKLNWKSYTPQTVKSLVQSCLDWLQANALTKEYRPLNAFFSGSVKGFSTLPFWYPINFLQYLNGTNVDPNKVINQDDLDILIAGVQGVIDEKVYDQMLLETHFGQRTPIDFHGYNVKDNLFPFWSSEPYTYAVTLLAFSQYDNIDTNV